MHPLRSLLALSVALVGTAPPLAEATPDTGAVLAHYADLAQAGYGGALTAAQSLQETVATLIAAPTQTNLQAARAAWKAARGPYQETEVFRFGNPQLDISDKAVDATIIDKTLLIQTLHEADGAETNVATGYRVIEFLPHRSRFYDALVAFLKTLTDRRYEHLLVAD